MVLMKNKKEMSSNTPSYLELWKFYFYVFLFDFFIYLLIYIYTYS